MAVGIYELINHSDINSANGVNEFGEISIEGDNPIADNMSYANTQMMIQTQMNFGFVPNRLDIEITDEHK